VAKFATLKAYKNKATWSFGNMHLLNQCKEHYNVMQKSHHRKIRCIRPLKDIGNKKLVTHSKELLKHPSS
jgi:hypothetical protein